MVWSIWNNSSLNCQLIWFITYKNQYKPMNVISQPWHYCHGWTEWGSERVPVEMVYWTASEQFYKSSVPNKRLWYHIVVTHGTYPTLVDSLSSDLVLSDRYTIDTQPVEAFNLVLIWDACENTLHLMTRKPCDFKNQKSTFLNSNSIWKQWMKSHFVKMPLQIPILVIQCYCCCC